MHYRVVLTRKAAKELDKLPAKQAQLIVGWIAKNLDGCSNPKAIEGSKQIQGTKCGWRYRVGSYRILASILSDELVIEVVRVGHRQGVYANLPPM